MEREAARREAYTRLDTSLVGALLADDYLAPSNEHGGGMHSRADALRAVTEHLTSGDHPIQRMRSDSTRVRVYGDVAIVTGLETIEMLLTRRQPPQPLIARNLYTDVWVFRNGRWMLVNAQHTTVP